MGRCKNFPDNCKKLPDKCKYFPDSCKNFPDKSKNFPDFSVVKRSLTIKNRKLETRERHVLLTVYFPVHKRTTTKNLVKMNYFLKTSGRRPLSSPSTG